MRVLAEDVTAAGFCRTKTRLFFAEHGLNWSDFVQHGIDPDDLGELAAHPLVAAVIAKARERNGQ